MSPPPRAAAYVKSPSGSQAVNYLDQSGIGVVVVSCVARVGFVPVEGIVILHICFAVDSTPSGASRH